MKKLSVFLLILFLLPQILAVEFSIDSEFAQGQTLLAKVSGNFLTSIQKSDIVFYRGHVNIPFEYDIKEIDDDYYIYALLSGKSPNNYSLVIENARYMQGSSVVEGDLTKNFTITNQTADFSVKPGFAVNSDFSIQVQNLRDKKITIEIKTKQNINGSAEQYQEPITLKSGEIKNIDFSFGFKEPTFHYIELSTLDIVYSIPSHVPATIFSEEIFEFSPLEFTVSSPTNTETKRTIYVYNRASEAIKNVNLSLSNSLKPYATLSQETISKIPADSNIPIELTFFSEDEFEVSGSVRAQHESEIIYSQISVKFIANYTPSLPESTVPSSTKTCAELGYPICGSSEECSSGEFKKAKDNLCCIGTCVEKEKSNAGKIVGIIILIAIVACIVWFFTKYKKTKKPFDLLKSAKQKNKN